MNGSDRFRKSDIQIDVETPTILDMVFSYTSALLVLLCYFILVVMLIFYFAECYFL
jgi:hypothetical protein